MTGAKCCNAIRAFSPPSVLSIFQVQQRHQSARSESAPGTLSIVKVEDRPYDGLLPMLRDMSGDLQLFTMPPLLAQFDRAILVPCVAL